jgi:uncharacterized protein YdeI (YjbR/CyaY-like superfamily)
LRAAADAPVVTVASRAELRAWLEAHHARPGPVWLATWKKPHPDHVPYPEVVEELLCWGWVDSVPRRIDEDRGSVLIAPRNPASAWSAINKAHVARARASGAMTPAGEAKVSAAMANGQWAFLDDVERLEVPPDLAEALGDLRSGWDAWPRSVRRGTLEWLKTAKTEPTRRKRIADITESLSAGLRPSPFRR